MSGTGFFVSFVSPYLSQDQPINVIYAYGTTDEISYHGQRRGVKQLNLLNYMPRTNLNNSKYISATVESVRINVNNYSCEETNYKRTTLTF